MPWDIVRRHPKPSCLRSLHYEVIPGTITGGRSPVDWGLAIRIKSDGLLNIGHPEGTLEIDSTDPSFRDPKTVFDASCFFDSSSNQFGYLKPIGDMEMTAAFGSGPCPSEMPSDSQTFYR